MNTKLKMPILVIEDNPADTDLIKIYLQEVGFKYELYLSDSLETGLELVETKDIELVMLDLSLVDSSGFKTLTRFLEKASHVPVIVMTGLNNEIIGNQAVKAGAQDFLVKGQFDGKQLGRSIRYALQRFKTQAKLEEMARSLAISENRYQEAQELAHFGNWEMDIVSNQMKWSDEMFRIFGFQPNNFEPSLTDYIRYSHYEDKAKVEEFFEQAIQSSDLHHLEHRIVVGGKTIKFVSQQVKLFFDDFTEKVLLVGAIQDITERKLSEQLLLEKQMSAQATRLQEETLSDLSFHIRTPLNSIVNLIYLLDNTRLANTQKEYIQDLKTSVDDLSIVINNLLNFAILGSEKVKLLEEEVHMANLLGGLEKMFTLKADMAGVRFQMETKDSLPEKLVTDAAKITQLLFNLVDIAIQNLDTRGFLKLIIQFGNEEANEQLQFFLEDNGPVMSAIKTKATEGIETYPAVKKYPDAAKRQQLHFSIATKILSMVGGELEVKTFGNRGNLLKITIPVKQSLKRRIVSSGDKPSAPLRILMVEDHFLNQMSTKKVLTSWSEFVSVDIADNGKIALDMFDLGRYDLVLMDIHMPIMNGIEATQRIRQISDIPIIALTANASKQEADKCYEAGMNDYLVKPFKPLELYEKILALLIQVEKEIH